MLAVTDGGRHRQLRNVTLKAFSPRFLESVAERVRRMTDRLVAETVAPGRVRLRPGRGRGDPDGHDLPSARSAGERPDHLLKLAKSALSSEHESAPEQESVQARNEILLYFLDLLDQVREKPREGGVSALATGSVGDPSALRGRDRLQLLHPDHRR